MCIRDSINNTINTPEVCYRVFIDTAQIPPQNVIRQGISPNDGLLTRIEELSSLPEDKSCFYCGTTRNSGGDDGEAPSFSAWNQLNFIVNASESAWVLSFKFFGAWIMKRRRFSRNQWQQWLAEHAHSNQSVRQFCGDRNLPENSFYRWWKILNLETPSPLANPPTSHSKLCSLRLRQHPLLKFFCPVALISTPT